MLFAVFFTLDISRLHRFVFVFDDKLLKSKLNKIQRLSNHVS